MRRGSLSNELLNLLPDDLRYYYNLDLLFASGERGTLTWLVAAMSEWWYGPVVGEAFTESVLTSWSQLDPGQIVPPIA